MNKIKRHLSAKLGLSIVVMAVVIFILALGALFFQSRYYFRQVASERTDNALNTMMQQVRNYMTTVETATNANIWMVETYFQPDSLLSISRRIVQLNRHVNGCSITAEPDMFPQCGRYFSAYTIREGDSIVTAREAEYDYYEKVWYKTPRQLGKACWVDPFDDYNEGTLYTTELIASYCKPIYLKGGQIAGIISTDLSFRELSEAINQAERPYPNTYFVLIGGDGKYFIHPDSTKIFKSTIFADADPDKHADLIALGHEMVAGKQGQMHVNINDRNCHVSYRPVAGTAWSLALVCPESDILKKYYQLTYIVLLIIIIGLILIFWLSRRIVNVAVRPVSYLVERLQRVFEGHFDEVIPHTERVDAIGRLQNSFATMQQSINDHVGSIRQATEESQKRNEELVIAKHQAEEAVRQKDLFIQNVSHQIRTPLNIVLGFADVLRNNPLIPDDMTQISEMIKYNALHLNRMVIMLFDTSETGISNESLLQRDEQASCNDMARECIDFIQNRFPNANIRFETSLSDDVTIQTNRLYMMRTIRELLYNAAKYSDGQHILLSVSQTEKTVRFVIEDVGPGLPEGLRNDLFEPFTKVDDMSEGLGLGLPLTKRHAQSLGGDLIYDMDYHDGCRFIVEMPK